MSSDECSGSMRLSMKTAKGRYVTIEAGLKLQPNYLGNITSDDPEEVQRQEVRDKSTWPMLWKEIEAQLQAQIKEALETIE